MQQFSRDWGGNWDFSTFLWNRTCATSWFCSSWLHKMVIWAMCFQAPVRQNQQCLLLSVTPWKRSLIPGSWILQSESGFRLSHCFAYCGILILSRKNHPNVSKRSANSLFKTNEQQRSCRGFAARVMRSADLLMNSPSMFVTLRICYSTKAHFRQVSNIVCFPCWAEIKSSSCSVFDGLKTASQTGW